MIACQLSLIWFMVTWPVPNIIFDINIFEIIFEKEVGILQDSCLSHFWDQKATEIPVLESRILD